MPEIPNNDNTSACILVAEDNHINRRAIVAMLRWLGCSVIAACNGREAVALTTSHRPALILMDLHMPEMDGLTATRAIRQFPDHQHTPIIAITGDRFPGVRESCRNAGMDHFLPKPFEFHDLQSILRRYQLIT